MPHDEGLPQVGKSQDIGDDAIACLYSNQPRNWKLSDFVHNDFGFDNQVQLTAADQVVHPFRLQLKGTRSPKLNAQGTHFSLSMSVSTLRYFDNTDEPVLIVLCDLSVDPAEPRECPAYYVWARDEVERLSVAGIALTQDTAVVHIPVVNRVRRDTDLLPQVRLQHRLSRLGHRLNSSVAQKDVSLSPEGSLNLVEAIFSTVSTLDIAVLQALAESGPDIWTNPPQDSLPGFLTEAKHALDAGLVERCEAHLRSAAASLTQASAQELAEYKFLEGRVHRLRDREDAAAVAFLEAQAADAQPRYLAAWAESELRRRFRIHGADDFVDVLQALTGSNPTVLGIKARILAAAHQYDAAMALLDGFEDVESLAARAVIQTMYSKPDEAHQACVQGLALGDSLNPSKRLLFIILRARAMFSIALRDADVFKPSASDSEHEILPPSGPLGTDAQALRNAWSDIEAAVDAVEEIRWSANTEFVVDMWAATASMLGRQRSILPRLLAAAQSHPDNADLQVAADAIAAQCGEFDKALEANGRSPRSDIQVLRRVGLLHELGKHRLCADLMEQNIDQVTHSHQMFLSVMVPAILSADTIARSDLVQSWMDRLRASGPAGVAYSAEADYFLALRRNALDKSGALKRLLEVDAELGHPDALTKLLFQELEPDSRDTASTFLEVAARLRKIVRLAPIISIRTGFAHAALSQWPELLALCEEAAREFDAPQRIEALQAFALDQLGRSDEARQILERLIDSGVEDGLALQAYINIMIRWGAHEKARAAVESILAGTQSRERQLDCVRLLFNLEQRANPSSGRLVDLSFRYGELVLQDDEIEEGAYLTMVFAATSLAAMPLAPDRLGQFQARAAAFFRNFPHSRILRQIEMPHGASPEQLLHSLKMAIGVTPDVENYRQALELKLKAGEQPMPFAWRPKLALTNVTDVAHLWEMAKNSSHEDHHLHLTMGLQGWSRSPVRNFEAEIPLFDLHTLMVLRDLDLFPVLFRLFPKVAIAQQTLLKLAGMAQGFTGSLFHELCAQLQLQLAPYQSQILQPLEATNDMDRRIPQSSRVIKGLVQTGAYLFYSDDMLHRLWVLETGDSPRGFCTLDLLMAAEDKGWLTTLEVADKLAMLCQWQVGMEIPWRYHIRQLREATEGCESVGAAVASLDGHSGFNAIGEWCWREHVALSTVVNSTGQVLRDLLLDEGIPMQSVVAYLVQWLRKVATRSDMPASGHQLLPHVFISGVAVSRIPMAAASRMWSAYFSAMRFVLDRWDQSLRNSSIALLAQEAGRLDKKIGHVAVRNAPSGRDKSTIGERLVLGLGLVTPEYKIYSAAYIAAFK